MDNRIFLPLDGGEEARRRREEEPTLPANASRFSAWILKAAVCLHRTEMLLLRIIIAVILWLEDLLVFANESLVNRFIAEMDLSAAINGAASMDSIPQYYH